MPVDAGWLAISWFDGSVRCVPVRFDRHLRSLSTDRPNRSGEMPEDFDRQPLTFLRQRTIDTLGNN